MLNKMKMTRLRLGPQTCFLNHDFCCVLPLLIRMAAAAAQGKQDNFMRSMLVFKMGCQQWLEDYGSDTSGYVYKSVKDPSHDATSRNDSAQKSI